MFGFFHCGGGCEHAGVDGRSFWSISYLQLVEKVVSLEVVGQRGRNDLLRYLADTVESRDWSVL